MTEPYSIPPLLAEAAKLSGRGMHPDDTVALVRHYSGVKPLDEESMNKILERLDRAQAWEGNRRI